jgi:hypothetical protein
VQNAWRRVQAPRVVFFPQHERAGCLFTKGKLMGCCAHIYHNNNRLVEKADRRTHNILRERGKGRKKGKRRMMAEGHGCCHRRRRAALLFHPLPRCYYYNCIGYDIAVLSFSRLLCIPIVFSLLHIFTLSADNKSPEIQLLFVLQRHQKRSSKKTHTHPPEQVHYYYCCDAGAKQRAKISSNRGEPSALHTGQWMPRLHSNERRAHY